MSEATPLAWYWLFSKTEVLLDSIPADSLQPCCGVNHGNQKDVRLSILYKVEIVIIYYIVYLFINVNVPKHLLKKNRESISSAGKGYAVGGGQC